MYDLGMEKDIETVFMIKFQIILLDLLVNALDNFQYFVKIYSRLPLTNVFVRSVHSSSSQFVSIIHPC